MRFLLLTFCSFFVVASNLYAIGVSADWTNSFERIIQVSCQQDEGYLCSDLCQEYDKCQVLENYCGNCGGDNLFLRHFFSEVGESITSIPKLMPKQQFIDILREGNFITLDAKSIYNFIDKFNSFETKQRFARLCPTPTEAPLVFVAVSPSSREPTQLLAVACSDQRQGSNLFHLKTVYQLEVN